MAAAVGQQLPGQRAVARARLSTILSADPPQQRSQDAVGKAASVTAGGGGSTSDGDDEDSDDDDDMMLPLVIPEDGSELDPEVGGRSWLGSWPVCMVLPCAVRWACMLGSCYGWLLSWLCDIGVSRQRQQQPAASLLSQQTQWYATSTGATTTTAALTQSPPTPPPRAGPGHAAQVAAAGAA